MTCPDLLLPVLQISIKKADPEKATEMNQYLAEEKLYSEPSYCLLRGLHT